MSSSRDVNRDLESPDPEVRRRATAVIPELPSADATVFVIRALGDPDWRVRKEAGQIALLIGPSRHLVDQLVALLFPGDNVGLRNAAVETLAFFGRNGVPAVVRALPSSTPTGRSWPQRSSVVLKTLPRWSPSNRCCATLTPTCAWRRSNR